MAYNSVESFRAPRHIETTTTMSTATDLAQVPSKPEAKAESLELSDKVSNASTDEAPVAELTDDSLVPSSVWAKIDLCILPVVSLMYFLSSLVGTRGVRSASLRGRRTAQKLTSFRCYRTSQTLGMHESRGSSSVCILTIKK